MRFSCLNTVAPGVAFAEQCNAIAQSGCEGVETIVFPTTNLDVWQRETSEAARNAGVEIVAVIVGGLALYRKGQMDYVREAVSAIAELDAAVLLTPEYASQNPLPLIPPYPLPPEDETAQVHAAMHEISELATGFNARVLIEPVTQFESRFCRSVADALALCKLVNNPRVQVALDTHNMNITEASIDASIRSCAGRIGHVHLADNNRLMPGRGHINFEEVIHSLRDVGYDGSLSFECAASSDFVEDTKRAIAWLRTLALNASEREREHS